MEIKHQILCGIVVGTVVLLWFTDHQTLGVITICMACLVMVAVNTYTATSPISVDRPSYSDKVAGLGNKTLAENATLKLSVIFESLEEMITMEEFDEDLQSELSAAYQNVQLELSAANPNVKYMTVLQNAKHDLKRKDCSIVITGETSAGKSSLMNTIVGRKIFPVSNIAATGRVCRLRNSERLCVKTLDSKESCLLTEEAKTESELQILIQKYSKTCAAPDEMANIYYVDVYLPFDILKGNVIIVDTPGIGESEELDKMLIDFLPSAVSMIFMINANNAGGIQNGRLSKIFYEVLRNLDKMPCFDPKEVIFLTNKWDIVEENDTTGVNEHEITWQKIIEKLKYEWPFLTEENIFKVSLKQGKSGSNTFSKELKRFEKLLHKTIKQNQNKRIMHHYSFLEEFMQNAGRGTLARLQFVKELNEKQQNMILTNIGRITILQRILKTKKREFESDNQKKTKQLTMMLHKYLNSEAVKEKIMTPTDDITMSAVPFMSLKSKLAARFENAIQTWINGDEMKYIVNDVDVKINDLLKDIESRLNEIETDMTGLKTPLRSSDIGDNFMSQSVRIVTALSRVTFFTTLVDSYFRMVFVLLFNTEKENRTLTEKLFSSLLASLSHERIGICFENSFESEYEKTITNLFDHKLKQKAETLEKTNFQLNSKQETIRKKQYAYERLQAVIQKIEKERDEFVETIKHGEHIPKNG